MTVRLAWFLEQRRWMVLQTNCLLQRLAFEAKALLRNKGRCSTRDQYQEMNVPTAKDHLYQLHVEVKREVDEFEMMGVPLLDESSFVCHHIGVRSCSYYCTTVTRGSNL